MRISDAQFESLAGLVNEYGGFTSHAVGPNAGETPTNVFSVGTQAEGEKYQSPARGTDLKSYATERASVFGPRRVLGAWDEGGLTHADVPRTYPTTPAGEVGARHATIRENQIAYGVLGDEDEGYMGDVNNPFHPKFAAGDITPGNPELDAPVWADMPRHTGVTSLQSMQFRAASERRRQ